MTRLLQEGTLGRFEQSFHDLDEEVRLMASAGAVSPATDGRATVAVTVWQRLLGHAVAEPRLAR